MLDVRLTTWYKHEVTLGHMELDHSAEMNLSFKPFPTIVLSNFPLCIFSELQQSDPCQISKLIILLTSPELLKIILPYIEFTWHSKDVLLSLKSPLPLGLRNEKNSTYRTPFEVLPNFSSHFC